LKVDCFCRKPKPGLIAQLTERWSISQDNSWMIGDTMYDVEAGHRAGLWTILLASGAREKRGSKEFRPPDFIFADLAAATKFILNDFPVLWRKAHEVAERFLTSEKSNIVIGGLSRVGKSTFSSILCRVLRSFGKKCESVTTDIFLLKNDISHSREFDQEKAERFCSGDLRENFHNTRASFHIHETNEDVACQSVHIDCDTVFILEGESSFLVNDVDNTFRIKISVDEDLRKSRFYQKYSLRGLDKLLIKNLFQQRLLQSTDAYLQTDMEIKL
jgi:hypothetical protein